MIGITWTLRYRTNPDIDMDSQTIFENQRKNAKDKKIAKGKQRIKRFNNNRKAMKHVFISNGKKIYLRNEDLSLVR